MVFLCGGLGGGGNRGKRGILVEREKELSRKEKLSGAGERRSGLNLKYEANAQKWVLNVCLYIQFDKYVW